MSVFWGVSFGRTIGDDAVGVNLLHCAGVLDNMI